MKESIDFKKKKSPFSINEGARQIPESLSASYNAHNRHGDATSTQVSTRPPDVKVIRQSLILCTHTHTHTQNAHMSMCACTEKK